MARREHHCPDGEDLTAFAHGEGEGATREQISRHLLTCPTCREEYRSARNVLSHLQALGPAWSRTVASVRRVSTWPAVACGAAAAVIVLGLFVVPAREVRAPARAQALVTAVQEESLLDAQRADGSWAAEQSLGGPRRDEAATALALLALLPEDAGSLREGRRARAIAAGSRWLLGLERRRRGSEAGSLENDAVSTSALLALYDVSREPGLRQSLNGPVRRLARLRGEDSDSQPTLQWAHRALQHAQRLGWTNVAPAIESIETRLAILGTATEPRREVLVAAAGGIRSGG
jgi:hypothetical protein